MALVMVAPTPNSTPLGGTTTVGYKQSGGALWWTALPLPLVLHQPCAYLPPLVYLPSPPRPVKVWVAGRVHPGHWQRIVINLSSSSHASRARNGDNPCIRANLSQPGRGIRRP